jgi:hypothetical protein
MPVKGSFLVLQAQQRSSVGGASPSSFAHPRPPAVPDVSPATSGSLRQPERGAPAVGALIRAAAEAPGQLHLVALGPLTNVALALLCDPSLPSRLASFTLMGAAEAVGNVTPCGSPVGPLGWAGGGGHHRWKGEPQQRAMNHDVALS